MQTDRNPGRGLRAPRPPWSLRRCVVVLTALVGIGLGEEIEFGGLYLGSYRPDSSLAPANTSIWSRGASGLRIRENYDNGRLAAGIACCDDDNSQGRIQISLPNKKQFGLEPRRMEYKYSLTAKFYGPGLAMLETSPPIAVAAVGFRDEAGTTSFGKTVMLGFFDDIAPSEPGKQRGLGWVDENTRLVHEIARVDFCDGEMHRYLVEKYLAAGRPLLRVTMDEKVLVESMDYMALSDVTKPQDGFGYYTSTPGTINASIAEMRYGAPVVRVAEVLKNDPVDMELKNDPRDIRNGSIIAKRGYADQPYIVQNHDGSITCLVTVAESGEGAASEKVVALRSTDMGKTWSAPVSLEPHESPENSYALPLITPSGRIYAIYNYNSSNLRTVKALDSKLFSRMDMLGQLVFRYSDDQGRTWSSKRYPIPIRTTDYDLTNVYKGDVNQDGKVDENDPKFFWCVGAPVSDGKVVYFGMSKIRNFRNDFAVLAETEGVLFRSHNVLTETDPDKIVWEMLPEGQYGLRSRGGQTCEEATPALLSDGTLVALCRTTEGVILSFYSYNQGRSWTSPEPLVYELDGKPLKNPRGKPAIWKISQGKYLLWFENNGNKWFDDRNPAWLAVGSEKNRRLAFSQPEICLYDRNLAKGISYPDFIITDGRYFITETQKTVARIHEVPKEIVQGMLMQNDPGHITTDCLVATWHAAQSRNLRLPFMPDIINKGFTIELWVKFKNMTSASQLFETANAGGRGIQLLTGASREAVVSLSDGEAKIVAQSDANSLLPGRWNHVVCIFDPGPRIIMWVINGRLSDGGTERVFGWTRYPGSLKNLCDTPTAFAAPKVRGEVKLMRFYDRALRVSEAIMNYRTGSDASIN